MIGSEEVTELRVLEEEGSGGESVDSCSAVCGRDEPAGLRDTGEDGSAEGSDV